jgi:hypothetical protein
MKSTIDRQWTNGFRAMKTLEKISTDARIDEIEGAGMDEGRVFIHLKRGFIFRNEGAHLMSVGSASEIRYAMSLIEPCTCEQCKEV